MIKRFNPADTTKIMNDRKAMISKLIDTPVKIGPPSKRGVGKKGNK